MTRLAYLKAWALTLGLALGACAGESDTNNDTGVDGGTTGGFCEPPLRSCGPDCVSLANDPNHCGGCFQPCSDGAFCDLGTCSSVCSPGLETCGAACADLSSDPTHCGACDQACAGDRMCVGGSCVCPPGLTECGGACVDTASDEAHCGMCNVACDADELCTGGGCACRTGSRESSCTNGVDDDCDDLVDCEDPDCEGVTRRCNGACGAGAETCSSGVWGACEGGSGEAEICGDGVDQDCMDGDLRNPDSYEPNGDCTQCRMLQPGADPMLSIEASFDSVEDEVDCFRFAADDGVIYRERIRVTLEGIPDGHDYDLYLYQDQQACQDSDPLAYSNNLEDEDETIDWGEAFGTDDSGTYFIRVVRYAGHSCTEGYQLTVDGLR